MIGGIGGLSLVALSLLAGCPANLEQPERFSDAGTAVNDPNAVPACMTAAFGKKCAGNVCHDKGSLTNDLDLTSPGVTARIVNVVATHSGVDMDGGTSCMPNQKIIDTSNGTGSWMLTKINDMQGNCGSGMPLTPPALTTAEKACFTMYFASLGASSGTGGSGGAASTGGSGGAATTGGGGAGGTATAGGTSGGGASGSGASGASTGGSGGSGGGASGSAGTGGA